MACLYVITVLLSFWESLESIWLSFYELYATYPKTAVAILIVVVLAILVVAHVIKECVRPSDPCMRSK